MAAIRIVLEKVWKGAFQIIAPCQERVILSVAKEPGPQASKNKKRNFLLFYGAVTFER